MMINKRNTRIVNNKKLLHKVGKQWVTVSIAMLSMLGAGVAAHSAKAANVSLNGKKPQTNVKAAQTSQPNNIKTATSGNGEQSTSNNQQSLSSGAQQSSSGSLSASSSMSSDQRIAKDSKSMMDAAGVKFGKPTIIKNNSGLHRIIPFVLNPNAVNGSHQLGKENEPYNPVYSYQAEQSPNDTTAQSTFPHVEMFSHVGSLSTVLNGQQYSGSEFDKVFTDLIKDYLLQDINQDRQQVGLRPVEVDPDLQKVSDLRSKQGYEAYVTQPKKFTDEQAQGNNSDSDNWIHGKDWHETFADDLKALHVESPNIVVGDAYVGKAPKGGLSFHPFYNEFENAGSFGVGQSVGRDIWPKRFYVENTLTPQGIANVEVNDMVFQDREHNNGHAEAILDPLFDRVGLGVYFSHSDPEDNADIQSDLKSHNVSVLPFRNGIYGAVEEDFTASKKMRHTLQHYLYTHMYPYTTVTGKKSEGAYIYQPSTVLWKSSNGQEKDLLGIPMPAAGSEAAAGDAFPYTIVKSNPTDDNIMGCVPFPGYMDRMYFLMPTEKTATDNNGNLWGQFKISTDYDGGHQWLGYMPLTQSGVNPIRILDPSNPYDTDAAQENLPGYGPENPPVGSTNPNENGNTPSGEGTGGDPDAGQSPAGGSTAGTGNSTAGGASASGGAAAGGAGGGANGTAGGTVAGGNGNNNSTKAGPNNNNNDQGPIDDGGHTSNNNNPSNNVVTPSNNMINNNDHDYHGSTNQGNSNDNDNDKALIIAAGMMNNNDPHYGDVIAALKDNDMNSALARNQYAAVSEMARDMSASDAAERESAAIVDEREKAEGADSAAYLKSSAAVQSLADSLANAANWQSEAQSIVTSAQAANTSHRGQLASANAAIDAAAQNALDALNNDSDLPENLKASYADQIEAKKGSALADALHGNDLAGLSAAVNGEGQQIQAAASTMNSEDFADGLHSAQSSLDSDVNSGLNSLNANSNLTSDQKSLATSTLNSAADVARKQFSLPTTNVSELGSLVNGMTSQTASVLSSAASQANVDMMSTESQADSTINSERAAAINSINAAPNLTANQKSAEISQVNSEANTEKSAVPAGGTSYANAVIKSSDEPVAHASALPPFPVLRSGTASRMSSVSPSVNPPSPAMNSRYPEPLYPGSLARSQKADSYNSNISGLPNPMSDHKVPHVTSAYSSEASSITSSASQPSSSKPASMASSASNSSTASSSSMNSLQSAIASIESSEGIKPASNTSASGSYASSATGTSTSSSVSSSAVSPASLTSSAVSERASARSALAAQEALLKSQNRIPGNDGYYDGKGLWHWNTAGGKRQPGVNGYYDKLGNWTPVNLSKLETEANARDDTSNGGYYDKFGFWHPGSSTSARDSQAVKPSSAAGQKSASASLSPKQRAIDSLVNTMTGHNADQKHQTKPTTKRSHWQWADNNQPLRVSGHFRGHESVPEADVPAEDVEPATNEFLPDGTVDGLKAMNGSGDPEGVAQVPNGVNDVEAGSDQSTNGQAQNGELPQTSEPVNDTEFAFGFLMLAFGLAAFDLGKKKKQRA